VASRRAAEAAARVAARYAKAPSYTEMLAAEARAAVRAAEAASRAALEAQAAAESLLAGLQQSTAELPWGPVDIQGEIVHGAAEQLWEDSVEPGEITSGRVQEEMQPYMIRWEEDLPSREAELAALRATRGTSRLESTREWQETSGLDQSIGEGFEIVEPAQPLHANLIQFPRELVATRKIRPRLAEGSYRPASEPLQLSIFEVDPGCISIEPEAPAAIAESVSPIGAGADWSGIRLDAQPLEEMEPEIGRIHIAPALDPAPISLRLMAAVVDGLLMTLAFLAAAFVVMENAAELPGVKETELAAVLAMLVIAAVYHLFFFTLGEGTPGMKWARISLCTFSDELPTRAQRQNRLAAMLVSLLPVGLGMAWAIFDEEHLSWHDRLSETYLRQG
jgi:uncharacterized RDD family membrane protein YckC